MNCEPLKKHIIDTVKEWQMKIGYRAESMKLYYLGGASVASGGCR